MGKGYNNPRIVDLENDCLRARLEDIKAGAQALVSAVERYARQECLRSELMQTKDTLKTLLK